MRDSVDDKIAGWAEVMPGTNTLNEQILGRISIVNARVSAGRSEALTVQTLAIWEFKTLLMLRRQGPPYELGPSRLAGMLGLTRGALSARLSGLESRGYLVREHDRDDRRRVAVRLTEPGRRAVEAQLDDESDKEQRLLSALTDREKQTLAHLLRKLVIAIESEPR